MPEVTEPGTSRFVDTPKWRLHYNEAGTDGPAVVLLHGSGPGASGWSNFAPNIGALAEHFHVYAVDMPGWGKSDTGKPEDRSHVEATVAFLDALGIDHIALVGNSMGGMTGIRLAVQHPSRLSHLITMGSPTPGPNFFSAGGGLSEGLKVLVAAYEDPSPELFKRLVQVMTYDPAFATDELAKQRAENALANPDHLAAYLEAWSRGIMMAGYNELVDDLPQVKTPTLAIQGRDDRTVHFENALRLVSLVPDSRLLMFNRCGHWAQLEHAAEFNRVVTDFVLNS